MPNHCSLVIVGHLGRDPEVRYTQNGTALAQFTVAVNSGKDENKKTTWFKVNVWKDLASVVAEEFKKGDAIRVEGAIECRKWNDQEGKERDSWEVTGFNVSKPVWKRRDDQPNQQQATGGGAAKGTRPPSQQKSNGASDPPDNDIPF